MRTRALVLLLPLCALLFSLGCMKRVNLTINNSTPSDLVVQIQEQDKHKFNMGDISVGTVSKSGGQAKQSFKVPKDGGYEVTANLPSSAQVFDQSSTVVGKNDPIDTTVTLTIGANVVPSNGDELKALFGKLGDDKNLPPRDLGNALKTLVGGLIVYAAPTGQNTEPEIRFQLTPAQFSSEMDLATFAYVRTDDSGDSTVQRDTTADMSASIPIYGQLSGNFSANSLYKVHAELKGYGNVGKVEQSNWNLEDALGKLQAAQKKAICAGMKDGKAKMMYINSVYALQLANFTYQAGTKMAAGAKINGGSVVSGDIAYSFENSEARTFTVLSSALNYSGITKSYSDVPCSDWEKADNGEFAQPINGLPAVHPGVKETKTVEILPGDVAMKLESTPAKTQNK